MKKKYILFLFLWGSILCAACAQQFHVYEEQYIPFDTITNMFCVKSVKKVSEHVFLLKVQNENTCTNNQKSLEEGYGMLDVAICDTLCSNKKIKKLKGRRFVMTIVSLFPLLSSPRKFDKMEANYFDAHFTFENEDLYRPMYYALMIK